MIKYTYVSNDNDGQQLFEGRYNGKFFGARFGVHMLIIVYRGEEHTFLEAKSYPKSEKTRKAMIEEFLLWQ